MENLICTNSASIADTNQVSDLKVKGLFGPSVLSQDKPALVGATLVRGSTGTGSPGDFLLSSFIDAKYSTWSNKSVANLLEGDTKPPEGDNSMKFVYHQLNVGA